MNSEITNNLVKNGYIVIKDCLDNKLIEKIKLELDISLKNLLEEKKLKKSDKFIENYNEVKKFKSLYEIQKIFGKTLVDNKIFEEILLSEKLFDIIVHLIGPDIEFGSDSEFAISDKETENDDYLIKKYHQEFWSGTGIESLQLWIPIHLLPKMGTLEIIKNSHSWGHIPHRNREPIEIPKNHESEIVDMKLGSLVILSPLTLHRTVKNKHNEPRIALPLTIRNPYYPNTGNSDITNFKKIKFSFFSKLRKILGNPQYSPFRIHGEKRKDLFK